MAVLEVKRPLHGGFGSGTAKQLTAMYLMDIPQRTQVSVRVQRKCNGCGRWPNPTALFWCQNFYRKLSQFVSLGPACTRGQTLTLFSCRKPRHLTHFQPKTCLAQYPPGLVLPAVRVVKNQMGFTRAGPGPTWL